MTITCTILLFAHLTDAVGQSQLTIELPGSATVNDALDTLIGRHSQVQQHRGTLAVAVNDRYADLDTKLNDGDTIALIPPVSGG